MTTPQAYAQANASRFLEELKTLVRIPSISTQPQHADDVIRAAEHLTADMTRIGFETAEIIHMPEGRCPLVFGTWLGAGDDAPTVLIYCHYDVQPAAIEDGWASDPFEPVVRGEHLYARGVVDSKIHVVAHLKAFESFMQAEGKLPVNIKVIFEGEEESGSETINAFVAQHAGKLKADYCIISDGSMINDGQPSLVYALRGITTLELHVYGPKQDLHSGHFGGAVHNPIQALSEILAKLHDENGKVLVPGFYDNVEALDTDERTALAESLPFARAEWKATAAAPQPYGELDYELHEHIGIRPTLEFNGIRGGYAGDGFKTVLPAHAMAKISCRLVANQQPQRIVDLIADHIAKITPPTVRSEVIQLEVGAPALVLDWRSEAMQAASRAYEAGWGVKPIIERVGGSVPIAYALQDVAEHMIIMGFGYRSGNAHDPSENIHVPSLQKGILTAMTFLQEIAT